MLTNTGRQCEGCQRKITNRERNVLQCHLNTCRLWWHNGCSAMICNDPSQWICPLCIQTTELPIREGTSSEAQAQVQNETLVTLEEDQNSQTRTSLPGESVDITEYLDPIVPGPHAGPLEEDSTGWNMIDLWGVWDCTLCQFPTKQDIPAKVGRCYGTYS